MSKVILWAQSEGPAIPMGDSVLANQTYSEEIVTSVSQTRGDFPKKAASVIMEYEIKLNLREKNHFSNLFTLSLSM